MSMQDIDAIVNDCYSHRLSNTKGTSTGCERNRVGEPIQKSSYLFVYWNTCMHCSIVSSKKVAVQLCRKCSLAFFSEVANVLTVFPLGYILPTCQDM